MFDDVELDDAELVEEGCVVDGDDAPEFPPALLIPIPPCAPAKVGKRISALAAAAIEKILMMMLSLCRKAVAPPIDNRAQGRGFRANERLTPFDLRKKVTLRRLAGEPARERQMMPAECRGISTCRCT